MSDERETRGPDEDASDATRRTAGAADAAGGATGAAVGAAAGGVAGPVGALAGGAIGGLAGFLAGSQVREAAEITRAEDEHYRRLHEREGGVRVPYEHVRELYQLGHVMGESREYGDREWREVEPELREAWTAVQRETWGEWPEAAPYVRRGFEDERDERT